MQTYKAGTPEGTRDWLFDECVKRRETREAMTSLFSSRGYGEVVTPEVEYYDLFVTARDPLPQEAMLKLVDKSGKLLVMRPDCTAPIARLAVSRLRGSVFPQRLYYDTTIFRSGDELAGKGCEIAQCGIELIGSPGLRGDIEAVAMAVDSLLGTGLRDFRVELGHVGYFNGIAASLGADEEEIEQLRGCIESKNFARLKDLLPPGHEALGKLPYLFGGVEVLDEASELTSDVSARAAVDYLRAIYVELKAAGREKYLSFDLGLVQRLDYYSGLIFRCYAEGAGGTVLAGGRYDGLIARFGRDLPATGFAVYVDSLVACLEHKAPARADTMIYFERGHLASALNLLDELEDGSAELSPCDDEQATLALARRKGFCRMFSVGGSGIREVLVDAEN